MYVYIYVYNVYTQRTQTSLRRLQDVLKRSRRLATKTRRRDDVWKKTSHLRRLEDV